jgi:hypothetical protein
MPKPKITKTLSLDRTMAQAIEKIARQERRSFTRQCEILLENGLNNIKQHETQPIAETANV